MKQTSPIREKRIPEEKKPEKRKIEIASITAKEKEKIGNKRRTIQSKESNNADLNTERAPLIKKDQNKENIQPLYQQEGKKYQSKEVKGKEKEDPIFSALTQIFK